MTFARQNPTGWSTGDQLTASQINGIDTNQSLAVDGDAGGTYSPTGFITISSTSTLKIDTSAYLSVSGTQVINASGVITHLGAMNCVSGSEIAIGSGADLTIESGGLGTIESGGDLAVDSGADINLNSGGEIYAYSGSDITLGNGSNLTGNSGSNINIASGADIEVASGGDINVADGGTVVFANPDDATCTIHGTSKIFTPPDFQLGDTDGDGSVEWQAFNNGSIAYAKSLSTDDSIQIGLASVPERAIITSVAATVQGDPGSHSALPGSMPEVRLYRQDTDGTLTLEGSQADTSGTYGAFETLHTITLSALSEQVRDATGNEQCFVMVTNESGANSQPGFRVMLVKVSFTMTYMASFW